MLGRNFLRSSSKSAAAVVSPATFRFSTKFLPFVSLRRSFALQSGSGKVVRLSYADLKRGKDYSREIEEAYGPDGLGILTVSGVPTYVEKRLRLLSLAQPLAQLPDSVKLSLEDPTSIYYFGWSHGKEKFDGQWDLLKGSYYGNPQYDVPTTDKHLMEKYPTFCRPNIWPKEQDLPHFRAAFRELGQLIVDVGLLVAKHTDTFVTKKNPAYPKDKLFKLIQSSHACKARLLHYFPPTKQDSKKTDLDWCGWHLDFGSLTGLTSALYTKECKRVPNPDPDCGLYIKDRTGKVVKATIPEDEIAFQIGETSAFQSGLLLQATPHYVKMPDPAKMEGIARNTFAVFMQPQWDESVSPPAGADPKAIEDRFPIWKRGMTFAEYAKAKFPLLH